LFFFFGSNLFGQTSIDWKLMPGPRNLDGTYSDIHQLFFDRNNTLFALGYYGLFISTDGSKTWRRRQPSASEGFINYAMALDTNSDVLVATEKGIFRYRKNSDTWDDLNDLLPTSKVLTVGVATSGTIYIAMENANLYISTNNGSSWSQKNQGYQYASSPALYAGFDGDMFMCASSRTIVANDKSTGWTLIPTLPHYIEDYLRFDTLIYAADGAYNFYLSLNRGKTFSEATTTQGPGYFTSDSRGKLWSESSTSTDKGHTWKNLVNNSRYTPVHLTCDTANFLFGTLPSNSGTNSAIIRTVLPVASVSTKVEHAQSLVTAFPNPTLTKTTFSFTLPYEEFTVLKIYNPLGIEIATLVNQRLPTSDRSIEFDASHLPSGVYYYRLQVGGQVETKPLVVAH